MKYTHYSPTIGRFYTSNGVRCIEIERDRAQRKAEKCISLGQDVWAAYHLARVKVLSIRLEYMQEGNWSL